ncbi:hypothetical protein LTR67_010685 [Exophiala xenobiotica]|jgi:catechol 2,3-dioxygenase-like lactoylglutathione lyase family enzyme
MISGLAHVNLTVPSGTLEQANEFYGTTLGLTSRPVPELQRGTLAWFDIGTSSQEVHIAFGAATDFGPPSSRHPCFKLESPEKLIQLRQRIWDHFVRGGAAAPQAADRPGIRKAVRGATTLQLDWKLSPLVLGLSHVGAKGVEYPQRFFARDYAGNRLEFSL